MKTLNYTALMNLKPTLLGKMINQREQEIAFFEDPTNPENCVIAVFAEQKEAVRTDFFDLGDFYEGSDYNPVYMHGELQAAYLLDL